MSDETKKPGGPEYTVDEILAEYGSKGRGAARSRPSGRPKVSHPRGAGPKRWWTSPPKSSPYCLPMRRSPIPSFKR